MIIELSRVDNRYYLKLDGKFVIDPRFIYTHIQAGQEKFNHIKEIVSKFGEVDYEIGNINSPYEETILNSVEINKGDRLFINNKISGRLIVKK